MFTDSVFELIREAATNVPSDIVEALVQAKNIEAKNSKGRLSLGVILKNIELARTQSIPICQDTGALTFYVEADPKYWQKVERSIQQAVKKATKKGMLRGNAVDPVTEKNLGSVPKIDPSLRSGQGLHTIKISLLLKGGGSENVSGQVSLPMETDAGFAGRDLDGVRKAVLQMVKDAGGKGCAPGIISVVIGGDRAGAFALAKKNLLQQIGAKNSDKKLAKLETDILREANELKIGAMGLGGRTTVLDCRVAALPRHPASYFVTMAYSCWALRRASVTLDAKGELIQPKRKAKNIGETGIPACRQAGSRLMVKNIKNIKKIQLPVSESEVRKLKAGDVVSVSGTLFTARDRVHALACKKKLPQSLKDLAVFHCGPIMLQRGKSWRTIAAGPTTSARLDAFTPKFLEKTGVRVLIGKGGMGENTQKALKKFGGVYLHAIGGAAAFYADSVKKVHGVDFLDDFGMPEAMWNIEVEDFLAVVGIDARGKQL